MSTFLKSILTTSLILGVWTPSATLAQDACENITPIMAPTEPTDPQDPDDPDDPVEPEGPMDPPIVTNAGESAEGANNCFVGGRAAAILSNQPDLQTRRSAQNYGIYASQAGGIAETEGFSGPLWVSLSARKSELDGAELNQGIATVGGDLFFTDNSIFGVMLQSDFAYQDGPSDTSFDATGVMAGVYAIYISGDLAFDARLLGGRSSTDVSGSGDRVDGVDSTRWLAAAQVSSQTQLDNGHLLVPHASVGWFEDKMDAYTLNAVPVEEKTIRYGQADLGGTWLIPITMGSSDGNIILGASGIIGFGESAGEEVPDDLRGRVDVGIELFRNDAWSVSGMIFGDGLGDDNFEAYGADLGVTLWF